MQVFCSETTCEQISLLVIIKWLSLEAGYLCVFQLQSSEILCVTFSLLGGCLVSSGSHLIHQLKEFDSRVVQVRGSSELNPENKLKTS